MIQSVARIARPRRVAIIVLLGLASLWSMSTALGYYSYVRSPIERNTTVSSTWSHGAPYGERALDLASSGESIFSYMENPNATDWLYYEVYDYKAVAADCPGSKFLLYDHTPGGNYYYYGRINYVHLTDMSWGRSANINPGQSESHLYVGYTVASCGAPVHLHTGHSASDGMYENVAGNVNDTIYQGSLLMYH